MASASAAAKPAAPQQEVRAATPAAKQLLENVRTDLLPLLDNGAVLDADVKRDLQVLYLLPHLVGGSPAHVFYSVLLFHTKFSSRGCH